MNTPHFRRDRLTIYGYVTVSAYIWAVYALGPALLIMRDETGMSRTVSSLHSTALALGIFLVGFVGTRFMQRLGRARAMQMGTLFAALGILGFAWSTTPVFSLPSALILGLGGSMAINAQNAFFSIHHGTQAPAAIGESNAMAVLAGLLSPLALGAMVAANLSWRLAMCVPVAMFILARVLRGNPAELEVRGDSARPHGTRLPRLYWWAWSTMTLCVATEFSFVLWSGDVLRDQADVSTATAAAALSAVAIGMAIARFTISPLSRHYDIERLFLASLVLPIAAWVPMWLSTSAPVILSSMFVIGLGLGYHFPLTMNRLLVAAPGLADAAATRSSLASGLAIGASPFVLATLSDAIGLHSAFVMVPVLLTVALAVSVKHPVRA